MGSFQHPVLLRGIVHTSHGAFIVKRGIVTLPDDVGQSFGWVPVEEDEPSEGVLQRASAPRDPLSAS